MKGNRTQAAASAQVITMPPHRMAPPETSGRIDADVVTLPGTPEQIDVEPDDLRRRLTEFAHERLTGDFAVDDFGFDRGLTESLLLPLSSLLFDKWFRVEVYGGENLPADGAALIVCNHSGTVPLDAIMTSVAVHRLRRRFVRMLAADLVFALPVVGSLARKAGATLACHDDAERLLRAGELVGVFPEGFKGIGKPFRSRYRLQRFGRGGFVTAAMRAGVPVVPCSIVGAEETYPKIADIRPLARLFGLPYFPVTPTFPLLGPLGAVPLPTKWHITFGAPMEFDADDVDDPEAIMDATDRVREALQQDIYARLEQRHGVFR